jgi:parallel beta-helix repeat protein
MRFIRYCYIGILFAQFASATTYYVDSNAGNDSNSGTSPSGPWKTIAKVNSQVFNPGDQVLFSRGDIWRETLAPASAGLPGSPVVFGAYGSGNNPKISGANLVTGWTPYSGSIWMASVSIQPNVAIFNGTPGTKKTSISSLQNPQDWYWSSSTLYVFSPSDPDSAYTNPGVEAGARNRCVSVKQNYLRFQNLTVSGCNGYGIANDSPGVLLGDEFRNLTVQFIGNTGIQLAAVQQAIIDSCVVSYTAANGIYVVSNSTGLSTTVTMSNNTAHHIPGMAIGTDGDATHLTTAVTLTNNTAYTSGDGLYIHYTDNSTISGNVSYSNTLREGTGIGISGCWYNTIEKNQAYSNGSNGIEMSAGRFADARGAANNIVRYNIVYNNHNYGIKSSSSGSVNNQIYYNLIYGQTNPDTCALHIWSTGHRIFNNTIYNNYNGICLYLDSANISIENNIIANSANTLVSAPATVTGFVCDYNLYWPSSVEFAWQSNAMSFSAWKNSTGQDAHSSMANPQFVAPAPANANDLKLLWSSPAIDAGVNLGPNYWRGLDEQSMTIPFNTVNQNSFGKGWDIGAFVYRQQFIVVVH